MPELQRGLGRYFPYYNEALPERYGLRGKKRAEFQRAYAYLRDRMAHLR